MTSASSPLRSARQFTHRTRSGFRSAKQRATEWKLCKAELILYFRPTLKKMPFSHPLRNKTESRLIKHLKRLSDMCVRIAETQERNEQ